MSKTLVDCWAPIVGVGAVDCEDCARDIFALGGAACRLPPFDVPSEPVDAPAARVAVGGGGRRHADSKSSFKAAEGGREEGVAVLFVPATTGAVEATNRARLASVDDDDRLLRLVVPRGLDAGVDSLLALRL